MTIALKSKAIGIVPAEHGTVYLRTAEAAAYLGLGRSTLERMRIRGTGPAFRVLGTRLVTYAINDLDEFASRQIRTSTTKCAA